MAPHHQLGEAARPYAQVRFNLKIKIYGHHSKVSLVIFSVRDLDEKTLEKKISICREYLRILDVIDAGISHNIGITAWWTLFF